MYDIKATIPFGFKNNIRPTIKNSKELIKLDGCFIIFDIYSPQA